MKNAANFCFEVSLKVGAELCLEAFTIKDSFLSIKLKFSLERDEKDVKHYFTT